MVERLHINPEVIDSNLALPMFLCPTKKDTSLNQSRNDCLQVLVKIKSHQRLHGKRGFRYHPPKGKFFSFRSQFCFPKIQQNKDTSVNQSRKSTRMIVYKYWLRSKAITACMGRGVSFISHLQRLRRRNELVFKS